MAALDFRHDNVIDFVEKVNENMEEARIDNGGDAVEQWNMVE